MTQRIFDVKNEKDMQDLWNIVPEDVTKIKCFGIYNRYYIEDIVLYDSRLININWHDKTEITRPIQEATEADVGRLCCFGDAKPNKKIVGLLGCVDGKSTYNKYMMRGGTWFEHCRRLTKQEIEELC